MNLKVLSTLAVAGLLTTAANAQLTAPLDLEVLFTGTESTADGDIPNTNAEFDGVAVTPDGATVFLFDSNSAIDGVIGYTPGSPDFTVVATEGQLSNSGGAASSGDMAVSAAGDLYVQTFINTTNLLWKIPAAGFGSATQMVSQDDIDEIAFDENGDRVIISSNDAFATVAEDLVFVASSASMATPTVLATEAAIETTLSGMTGYVDDTDDDLNVADMTVQSDGTIILSHGFSSNRQINGSLISVSSDGSTISVFKSADDLITAAGADPNVIDIGNVIVKALSTDEILVHVQFSSNDATMEPFIGVLSADGNTFTLLGFESDFAADTDVSTSDLVITDLFDMDSKGSVDVDSSDNYYFFKQGEFADGTGAQGVLRVTGIRSFLDGPASVSGWSVYE